MDPSPPLASAPAPSDRQCSLLAGPAAAVAQLVLACLAFASLAYKRHIERPQRPVNIWALDVSKQAVSMLAAHICGMLIAVIAAHHESGAASQCAFYFFAYTFDTSLGVLLTILLHRGALHIAVLFQQRKGSSSGLAAGSTLAEPWYEALLQCGNYALVPGGPLSLRRWALQMGEWVACVVLARACIGTSVVLLSSVLVWLAEGLDAAFAENPTLLLFFVMIACPLAMNALQLLIQDAVLKWRQGASGRGQRNGELEPWTATEPAGRQEKAVLLETRELSAPV